VQAATAAMRILFLPILSSLENFRFRVSLR